MSGPCWSPRLWKNLGVRGVVRVGHREVRPSTDVLDGADYSFDVVRELTDDVSRGGRDEIRVPGVGRGVPTVPKSPTTPGVVELIELLVLEHCLLSPFAWSRECVRGNSSDDFRLCKEGKGALYGVKTDIETGEYRLEHM